jgi:hypothetical protein
MTRTYPAARLAVAVLAGVYLASVWLDGVGSDLPMRVLPRSLLYFVQVAQLFTRAATGSIDSRAEVWLCEEARWQEVDVGAYFPIDRDTKENRFHRTLHFYAQNRETMKALDWYLVAGHDGGDVEDGIARGQSIGGVRLSHIVSPPPEPGAAAPRWRRLSLVEYPKERVKYIYFTRRAQRAERCGMPARSIKDEK